MFDKVFRLKSQSLKDNAMPKSVIETELATPVDGNQKSIIEKKKTDLMISATPSISPTVLGTPFSAVVSSNAVSFPVSDASFGVRVGEINGNPSGLTILYDDSLNEFWWLMPAVDASLSYGKVKIETSGLIPLNKPQSSTAFERTESDVLRKEPEVPKATLTLPKKDSKVTLPLPKQESKVDKSAPKISAEEVRISNPSLCFTNIAKILAFSKRWDIITNGSASSARRRYARANYDYYHG
jgi:hypothetical protein